MAKPRRNAAPTSSPSPPELTKPMGTVRRSQAITTYGIGSIVDLTAGSVMPLGLEEWDRISRGARMAPLVIHEERLQNQLGLENFRLPPVAPNDQEGLVDRRTSVPCVRFPKWQECPKCHRLGEQDDPFPESEDGTRLVCTPCGSRTFVNPVRFITACRRGHISDFPWIWWAHRDVESSTCERPVLFLRSRGRSASLSDLYVECVSCHSRSSLGDAFSGESLNKLRCRGERPWLLDTEHQCGETRRPLQRGGSNIHFPVIASALSIPPASQPYFQILEEHWTVISAVPAEAIEAVLRGMADSEGIELDGLRHAYETRRQMQQSIETPTELSSRQQEYAALSSSRADEPVAGRLPQFCNETYAAPPGLREWFDLIGAVSRLREVRALAGFSRIEPYPTAAEHIQQALAEGHISPVGKTQRRWLPAAEIRGEGIFLRFQSSKVDEWIVRNPRVTERAAILEAISAGVASRRGYQRDYTVTPQLLLIHSFAHALIRQLSSDCGYSSSALRERLYVSNNHTTSMSGVLIYTGSPDSEGSLGGLVRLAQPQLIEETIKRAVRHSTWCGSDPVCAETDPTQSGERVSGAACHCCLLVPETACEKFNRELDRTLLSGHPDKRWAGFFETLIAKGAG